MDTFYSSIEWQKLRAKVKAQWRRDGKPCAFCGQALDWTTKGAVLVDHILNRKRHPERALDPTNLCCLHSACNTRKASWVEKNDKPAVGLDGFPENSGW